MSTSASAQQTLHPPMRLTSMLLAALVTAAVLGSIDLMAAERVAAARSAQQNQQVAADAACRTGG